MAGAVPAPSLASLLTLEAGADGVIITGGVVVRVHSCFRSFMSPDFFLNTGLTLMPDVDFTFDLEVCDGVERVSAPPFFSRLRRTHVVSRRLTVHASLHPAFCAHQHAFFAGDGDAAPGSRCHVRSRVDRERRARHARPRDCAQRRRVVSQTVRRARVPSLQCAAVFISFGIAVAPPL
jgi:hypothetical protein